MEKSFLIIFKLLCLKLVNGYIEFELPRNAFDIDMYEKALDEELCNAQLSYLALNNSLLMVEFLDAGIRTPRGILNGNFVDMGNYHQCLKISENFESSVIQGKYCMINIPLKQEIETPSFPELSEEWTDFPWPELVPNTKQNRKMMKQIRSVQTQLERYNQVMNNRVAEDSPLASQAFRLAVCVPKACTAKQAIDTLLINTTTIGLDFKEEFCRLKDDKPFVPGDYAAMGIFGFIIFITILSTCYDLYFSVVLKEPKRASTLCKSFSVYTNTRRLLTFNSTPGSLECLDGIRALAMMWVIVGHTYSTQRSHPLYNPLEAFSWMTSFSALWITTALITVDTFFLLSGLLIVYTTVGKLNGMKLLKNVHLFYLNRLLRMFPILATCVFLQASLFNHVSDGPEWHIIGDKVHRCRTYWWSTLTYVQNYATRSWCIGPSWYLAIDVQLHVLSPLILFWILGSKRSAWIALTSAMIVSLTAATTYNYINQFPPSLLTLSRSAEDLSRYTQYYYINTLTRCTPFFVGMLFGYLLNISKGKHVKIPKILVAICWLCAFLVSASILYSTYETIQEDWNNPFLDGFINSFARPAWAACIGWLIFACTHGYGGPVNWFLTLSLWKLPARLSFAMYLFHYPLMILVNASAVAPSYFTVAGYFFRFLADFMTTILAAFVVTLVIDSPFSTLIKLAMGGEPKRASTLCKSFSVYTNTRRLLTFNSTPGSLECLDGIRALAMMWVIVGHTYSTQRSHPLYNPLEAFSWMTSFSALWITTALITVETFFLLSGLLIVYTTVGKLNGMKLLKNVHLFYLNRLLRMFPILATCVFLQASLFNHVSDGPEWHIIGDKVHRCRTYWWSTLTYVQNYATRSWCIGPSWYLAIDVQLHVLSPLILFWVLGSKRSAWIALTSAMIVSLTAATTYNYINQFPPSLLTLSRSAEDLSRYTQYYYINTLTRCTPFFVGMLFGYLLNIYKGKHVKIPKILVAICWLCAFLVSASILYSTYETIQEDWNNPFLDGFINSFARPAWAACIGWLIFACTHGYGGPVNWFLTLSLWKLPARLSFAMYLFHYPLMILVNASAVAPSYFTVAGYFFRFLADFMTTILAAFVVTLVIDSPFSTLIKLAMGGGLKKPESQKTEVKENLEGL